MVVAQSDRSLIVIVIIALESAVQSKSSHFLALEQHP